MQVQMVEELLLKLYGNVGRTKVRNDREPQVPSPKLRARNP